MGKAIKFVYMILFVSLLLITAVDSSKTLILSIIIIFCLFYTQSFTNISDISLSLFYITEKCKRDSDCVTICAGCSSRSRPIRCVGGHCRCKVQVPCKK
jgi:hypothetical protein